MAGTLRARGEIVTVANAATAMPEATLRAYDGAIVGGSVKFGRHLRSVRRFVRAHQEALNALPSAFFSVSGAAIGRTDRERVRAQGYVDDFLRRARWHPALNEPIAGATAFTQYGPLFRWFMKMEARATGGPTDTSRDYEFTDWQQVDRFAEAFATKVLHPTNGSLKASA
jgi:menaquinone-dependent protoporphyrinogen oxidase